MTDTPPEEHRLTTENVDKSGALPTVPNEEDLLAALFGVPEAGVYGRPEEG